MVEVEVNVSRGIDYSENMVQIQPLVKSACDLLPERSVTPHRCLPLNPLVLSEQAQGWCWDVFSLSKSTGNTDDPTSLLSSFFFNLLLLSTDTSSNILNRTFLTDGHILNQIYTHLFISSSDIVSNRFLKFLIPFLKLLS